MSVGRILISRLRRAAARLAGDRRGLSAVEFALLFPVMALLYLGGNQISMTVATYRLVDLTANTVTNLVTQYTTISKSTQMPDILDAATQVMYAVNDPNIGKDVQVVVSLVSIDKNGNATVAWSQTLNGTARTVGQAISVPSQLDIPNTNVVFGEVTYPYMAAVDFLNLGTYNLYSSIFMVPRAATTINLVS